MKENKEVENQKTELVGKDVITPDDVSRAISGDQQALIEQLSRAKQVALEQLEARKKADANGATVANMKTQEELEVEVKRKEAELNAAMASASLYNTGTNNNVYQSQNMNVESKHLEAETEAKSRVKPIFNNQSYTSHLNEEGVSVTNTNTQTTKQVIPNHITPGNNPVGTTLQGGTVHVRDVNTPIANASSNLVNTSVASNNTFTKKQLKEQRKKQKQLEKEQKRLNSNVKYYMTILLFIGIIVLVYFFPTISNYLSKLKAEKNLASQAVITTGTLECELKKYDEKFDYIYESVFTFKDSKLLKLSYRVTTKGDQEKDILELTSLNDGCNHLKDQTSLLEGVSIKCSLNNGVNVNEQILRYDELDVSKVTTAYLEAGGVYPNFTYNEDIDQIEKNMKATGYTCSRYK